MKHKVIEQENKSIEAILGEIEVCITFIKKERESYSEKAENSEKHKEWLDNKLKEWEILERATKLLKKRATILDKVILK